MKPEISGIRLTIVELFGAFLPGAVWLLVFATIIENVVGTGRETPMTVVSQALTLLGPSPSEKAGDAPRILALFSVLGVAATLLGFSVKTSSVLYKLSDLIWMGGRHFPYWPKWPKHPEFRKRIGQLVNEDAGVHVSFDRTAPDGLPFKASKYTIRACNADLWGEIEKAEAEVAFLTSMLWACSISLIAAVICIVKGGGWGGFWPH